MTLDEVVAANHGWLFGLAYRMLGSAAEAEDAVQETFVRYSQASGVEDPPAWLRTVCTRVCLDALRSARVRREQYVGPWLPEPLLVDEGDPAAAVADAETLSLAFLVVLESLSPEERVAFLLHDVFGVPFPEVATTLGKSPAAVRQLASRARAHMEARRPRFEPDPQARAEIADAFLAACAGGDLDALLRLCAPDVELVSDGGGQVSAARRPVLGADAVVRMLLGLGRRAGPLATVTRLVLNGTPGALVEVPGRPATVLLPHIADGQVARIAIVRNPDKLLAVQRELHGGRR